MRDTPQELMDVGPGAGRLGVFDALGLGWQLLKADFWKLWLAAFVVTIIQSGVSMFGAIPYLGACVSLAAGLFLYPQLMAGLFFVVRQRIDGVPVDVGNAFEGFRSRYWQSLVATLPAMIVGFVFGLLIGGTALVGAMMAEGEADPEAVMPLIVVVVLVAAVVVAVICLFFMFALVAVWDCPASGWEAVRVSIRLVRENFLSALGFSILMGLLGLAAFIVGIVALCVGTLFTFPLVMVWSFASLTYLYRSWSGRPLMGEPLVPGLAELPSSESATPGTPSPDRGG